MGAVDLGDFGVAIGDDDFQAREAEQRRRDEEARRAAEEVTRQALQSMQAAAPVPPSTPPADTVIAEARGEAPPMRRTGATGFVAAGVPAGPPPDRGFSRVEEPRPVVPAPSQPSPSFRMPQVDARMLTSAPPREARPAAAGPSQRPQPAAQPPTEAPAPRPEGGDEASELGRWDSRIQAVQQIYNQERDARRRAVLGSLLMNLVMGASRALAGARQARPGMTAPVSALEQRLTQRLSDAQGEWDATDRAVLGALERRDEQGARLQQVQDREGQRELQARQLGLQERRLGLQEADAEQRRAAARAELERVAGERSQRSDPQSPLSQAYRDTMRQRIETYRATGQTQLADRLEGLFGQRLESMTAEQLEPLLGRTGGLPQVHTRGRAGGGTGAGPRAPGAPMPGGAADASVLDRFVTEGRLTEEQAESLRADLQSPNRRVRDEARRRMDRLAPGQGEAREIMPGLSVDIDIPNGEATSLRNQFGQAASSWGTLGRVRAVADEYGGSAVINPDAVARIEVEMTPLRAMVARIQGTGTINEGERPIIDAVLPDPSSFVGQTMGTFRSRLDQWERQAVADIEARFLPYVREERMPEVRQYLQGRLTSAGRSGGARPRSSGGGRVRIVPPAGSGREPIEVDANDPRVERFRAARGFRVEEVR